MVYYLIPKYLLTKKYFQFALYTFYTLVASSNLIVLVLYGCLILLLHFDITLIPPMSKNYFFILILVYLVVGMVSFINLLKHNFKTTSRNKELENKILAAQLQLKEQELHYLKMQIHPHFLFNTLNTIYGLALKQSKQTPEVILQLSNLLDYILYHVSKPKVSLKEEVLHIKEYVELERIRFQDTLKVKFNFNEMDEEIEIAPMLMLPFVENAFKHGNIVNQFLTVNLKVTIEDYCLNFSVENTILDGQTKNESGGIGLGNIKKRLDLYYKDNYRLNHEMDENWYRVNLTIFNLKGLQHG